MRNRVEDHMIERLSRQESDRSTWHGAEPCPLVSVASVVARQAFENLFRKEVR